MEKDSNASGMAEREREGEEEEEEEDVRWERIMEYNLGRIWK